MQGTYVWVIGSDSKAAPRLVTLGATAANNVVVSKGLSSGDRVVVEGILKVQPGAPVKVTPVDLDGDEVKAENGAGGKARS
jgi:membrane fusion protein, multidrug efflux system